jgi:hypothetical protein
MHECSWLNCLRRCCYESYNSCIRGQAKLSGLSIEPPSPEGAKYPSTGSSPVYSFVRACVRSSVHSWLIFPHLGWYWLNFHDQVASPACANIRAFVAKFSAPRLVMA